MSTGTLSTHSSGSRRAGYARLSKPARARAILTGTTGLIAAILFAWLALAPWLGLGGNSSGFLAGRLVASPAAETELTFQQEATESFEGKPVSWDRRQLEQALVKAAGASGREPLVLYVAGVGVSAPADGQGVRAFLLSSDGGFLDAGALVSFAELVEPLQKQKRPALILLDAQPIASDRNLGVFGNAFLKQIEPLLDPAGSIVVLAAAGPGQICWTSESDRQSVFAHFVQQGLSGEADDWGAISVQSLYRYVRSGVAGWVAEHRAGAVQTPALLGNTKLDFAIPKQATPSPSAPADEKTRQATLEQLVDAWKARDQLATSHSFHHTPASWRQYLESLLHAERLFRAGRLAEAERAIALAGELKNEIEMLVAARPQPQPWSLALLEAQTAAAGGRPVDSTTSPESYRRAISRAIQEGSKPSPQPVAPIPAPAPPPDEAATSDNNEAESEPSPGSAPQTPPADPARALGTDAGGTLALLGVLSLDAQPGIPRFLEGQMPLWYTTFRGLGGESLALQKDRQLLLDLALQSRVRAENILAIDPRALRDVWPLIEAADQHRRQAQDLTFANEDSGFPEAQRLYKAAIAGYDEAQTRAQENLREVQLLWRLQEALPYYGEWQARVGSSGSREQLQALLSSAQALAERLSPAAPASTSESAARTKVDLRDIEGRLERLEREFRLAVQERAAGSASRDWREIDALLRVPLMPAADRASLLAKLQAADPADSLKNAANSASGSIRDDNESDPLFWEQALALARLELGLLRLAGASTDDLASSYDRAREAFRTDQDRAFEAFDTFSARARSLRAELVQVELPEAGARPVPLERLAPMFARADRALRVLPVSTLGSIQMQGDSARRYQELLSHEWLLNQARRLSADFATQHAELLLADARAWLSSTELEQAWEKTSQLAEADLAVVNEPSAVPSAGQRDRFQVAVLPRGPVPTGQAAILLAHDPEIAIEQRVEQSDAGSLVPVAPGGAQQTPQKRLLSVTRVEGLQVNPVAFYRGRVFEAGERVTLQAPEELVSIEVRQRKVLPGYPDQFDQHPRKAYLHPKNSLDYKLLIKNRTPNPLTLFVEQRLGDQAPSKTRIMLEAHATDESLGGIVLASDIPDDKPLILKVEANEGTTDGAAACQPVDVELRKIHPKDFIVAEDGLLNGRVFLVIVRHVHADPVPVPVYVRVKVEPAGAVAEIRKSALQYVPRGGSKVFYFQLIREVPEVTWTVEAEGEEIARKKLNIYGDLRALPPAATPSTLPQAGGP